MTDNVSSKECESDEQRTEGPPPAKKLKQKNAAILAVPRIQLPPPLVLSHVRGRSQPPPARRARLNLVVLLSAVKGSCAWPPQGKLCSYAYVLHLAIQHTRQCWKEQNNNIKLVHVSITPSLL